MTTTSEGYAFRPLVSPIENPNLPPGADDRVLLLDLADNQQHGVATSRYVGLEQSIIITRTSRKEQEFEDE